MIFIPQWDLGLGSKIEGLGLVSDSNQKSRSRFSLGPQRLVYIPELYTRIHRQGLATILTYNGTINDFLSYKSE